MAQAPLAWTIALLIGSALVIYASCELFVNGVEWVGRRLAMGQQATGSILAAFGTALPESVVTLVAVAFGATAASKALGVGAALGGPLVLATIAYATVGLTLMACRQSLPQTADIKRQFKNWRAIRAGFWRCSRSRSGLAWSRLRSSRGAAWCSSSPTVSTCARR